MDHRQRTMNIISPAVFNSLVAPVGSDLSSRQEEPETPSATLVETADSVDGKSSSICVAISF